MKLRIKGNSIRLRLLRSEVERFAKEGEISDEISFGTRSLKYSVSISSQADSISAEYKGDEITISIPESAARQWANSDDVGFETEQSIGDSNLLIVVEKDFVCLDRPFDPDREDSYPNPSELC